MKSLIGTAKVACFLLTLTNLGTGQTTGILLSSTENAYNPVASRDGKYIAYVRTGRWSGGSGGFGRSNLRSDIAFMDANGNVLTNRSAAHCFLQAWLPDSDEIVCYRDFRYYLVSPPGTIAREGEMTFPAVNPEKMLQSERAAYLSKHDEFIWVHRITGAESELYSADGPIEGSSVQASLGDILVPSYDERYVAVYGDWAGLWVYDSVRKKWAYFGKITVHPSPGWDWMQPSWNPWFTDDRLTFVQDSKLIIASPDGNTKLVVLNDVKNAALAVPSPDGAHIAFATFDPVPMKLRPDLQFYGGSILWVAPSRANSTAKAVTQKTPETTFTLNWLGNSKLLFDRAPDESAFKAPYRLWTADIQ
jgi:hypothetical protein